MEMCRGFAADVQQQRGWKGAFEPSEEEDEEAAEEAAAAAGEQTSQP